MKIKTNTLFFAFWGAILAAILLLNANSSNYFSFPLLIFGYILFYYFLPLFAVLILNKITNTRKTERSKKIWQIITIIVNALGVIYLVYSTFALYVAMHMFD